MYDTFTRSACYQCKHCNNRGLAPEDADLLDVRRKTINVWCQAANHVVEVEMGELADCSYYMDWFPPEAYREKRKNDLTKQNT